MSVDVADGLVGMLHKIKILFHVGKLTCQFENIKSGVGPRCFHVGPTY